MVSSDIREFEYLPDDECSPQSRPGAGYDQIDVAACTVRSIRVSNVPCVIEDATADTTIFLIMGALRQFNPSMTTLRAGDWQPLKRPSLGRDLKGKTLGILGMGGIGQKVRSKAQTFGMNVIYHNRNPLPESMSGEAGWVTFEELLHMSDVLSISCPLNVRNLFTLMQFLFWVS